MTPAQIELRNPSAQLARTRRDVDLMLAKRLRKYQAESGRLQLTEVEHLLLMGMARLLESPHDGHD